MQVSGNVSDRVTCEVLGSASVVNMRVVQTQTQEGSSECVHACAFIYRGVVCGTYMSYIAGEGECAGGDVHTVTHLVSKGERYTYS